MSALKNSPVNLQDSVSSRNRRQVLWRSRAI